MVKHKLSLILTTLAFSTFDILFSLVGIWFHGNSLSFQQFSNAFAESYDVNKSVSDLFIFSLLRMLFLFVGCFILVFKREVKVLIKLVNKHVVIKLVLNKLGKINKLNVANVLKTNIK
uniref:7TM_GPCR_Srx domain-containing protein n=1 Tax=Meloidogyne hapla TaxID=6305 RepID=A0A1I8BVK5_MELHA